MTDINDDPPFEPEVDPWVSEEGDAVRSERNARLSATDWAVLPDSPVQRSLIGRAAVWSYRKALRDITENFDNPADVVWPDDPEEVL